MNNKELTLADLIARKRQSEKTLYKTVYVPNLKGGLKIKRLPLFRFMDMIEGIDDKSGARESMEKQIYLIYEHVPMLHNQQLQEEFECVEPSDIVLKILDEDIGSIALLVEEICGLYGVNLTDLNDEIKNS